MRLVRKTHVLSYKLLLERGGKKCLVGEEGINEIKLPLRATVRSRIKAET